MNELIYSITIEGINLKLEKNFLGYCFSLSSQGRTDVLIYSSLDESLAMMQCAMNLLEK